MMGPATREDRALLGEVEHALMELSVISATLRDFAGGTCADRVSVSPQDLRNYFHMQQERSDQALQKLRAVMHSHRQPNNWCRVHKVL